MRHAMLPTHLLVLVTVCLASMAISSMAQQISDPVPGTDNVIHWSDVFGLESSKRVRDALAVRPAHLQPVLIPEPLEAPSDHLVYLGHIALPLDRVPIPSSPGVGDPHTRLITDIRQAMPTFFNHPAVAFRRYRTLRPDDPLSTDSPASWDGGLIGAFAEFDYRELGTTVDTGVVALIENNERAYSIGYVDEGILGRSLNVIVGAVKIGLYRQGVRDVVVIRFANRFRSWVSPGCSLKDYNIRVWNAFATQLTTWLKNTKSVTVLQSQVKKVYKQASVGELRLLLWDASSPDSGGSEGKLANYTIYIARVLRIRPEEAFR